MNTIPRRLVPTSRPGGVALCVVALTLTLATTLPAQSPYSSSSDFEQHARMLRDNALMKVEPQVWVPTTSQRAPSTSLFSRYPWKTNIVTTIFWIGELPTARNPTPNHASSWDPNWATNYGGYDDPDPTHRNGYLPKAFIPRQNPFYCALPYNDVTRGTTKPEAKVLIPWFKRDFVQEGHSVCKSHWIAIMHGNRVAYAQWEDCGPFRTDHYQYVFGVDKPLPNLNGGAGLDVSPAVRDYLGMNATRDYCSWRFVDLSEVSPGPWQKYGDNNPFANRSAYSGSSLGNHAQTTVGGNPLFGR